MLNNLLNFIYKNSSAIVTTLFFTIFCFITYKVLQKKQHKKFDAYSKIPLNDDDLTQQNNKPHD
jgi:cbb3-type cytochrome oxidase subunit 3